ncbi:MAG TPA: outer membrane beta-barrel protein [Gemmatimonadales bacterium]|jgi:hypothetical protein
MRPTLKHLALVVLMAGSASALQAQRRDRGLVELPPQPVRSGLYFTGSLGAGVEQCKFESAPCAILDADGNPLPSDGTWRQSITSPSFQLRLGGTPSRNFRLGGELLGWSADNGPTTERTVGLLLSGQFYPSPRDGFYLKGGLGLGWNSDDFHDGSPRVTETGFLGNVGAGYDFPLTPHVAISPVIDFYPGSYPHAGDETLSERILFIGLSITFQSGRRF